MLKPSAIPARLMSPNKLKPPTPKFHGTFGSQEHRTTMDFSAKASRKPRVVGSGLIALDVLVEIGEAAAYQGLGGSAGNVLAILAYLGWASFPVARLGHDVAARRIEQEFQQLGAATHFLKADPESCTPVVPSGLAPARRTTTLPDTEFALMTRALSPWLS